LFPSLLSEKFVSHVPDAETVEPYATLEAGGVMLRSVGGVTRVARATKGARTRARAKTDFEKGRM
jgi:hypothetical protein